MKPISQFSEYNKDNILGNMLQAETHLKNLSAYEDPNFAACVNKHLLESQMELTELVAHDPKNTPFYRNLISDLRKLRKDNIEKHIDPDDAISRLRDIRSRFEEKIPGHNVEECRSCGDMENVLKEIDSNPKSINMGNDNSLNMKGKSLIGAFLGKGVSEATGMYVSGESFGVANKTLLNLGIGLGINALELLSGRKKIIPSKASPVVVPMANFLIADEVGDLVKIYMTPPAAAAQAPVAKKVVTAPSTSASGTVPAYSNGKHIFVD